ncbi:dentin sialophosphoprotein-like isoform X2 [Mercenaria mercenaria]|uniref:dentin sialophosphoprotein-like isoform X2 n=1 Tax=Mercenaria mercenaria TaxID=6596 RepID=UPI00234EF8D9|nr:dentin sialophosphoprotein-like isoform X2 [Mercenaria mercenaria]
MDSRHKEILTRNLPDFVDQVNPQQLLTYLPCLSQYSKEEIETAQNSKSRSYAAQVLHNHLIRKPEAFEQLIAALRHDSVGCTKLADRLDPNHSCDYTNGGGQADRRQSQAKSCHVPHSSPPVSPGAEGWCPSPQRAVEMQAMNGRHFGSPSRCDLDTPWEKLPAGVKPILKKFDAQQSLKKIDDLADKLDFNVEETSVIKAEVPPGESLTLAFLERWIGRQSNSVTLRVIMKIFYDLENIHIVHELERKTGVKFDGQEESDVSPEGGTFSQGGAGLSGQERNKVVDGRTRYNPNINMPDEKNSETDKRVLDVAKNRHISNRQSPHEVCPGNTKSVQGLSSTSSEHDNRNCRQMSQNDSADSIEETKMDNLEKFNGYRKQDILRNSWDDAHNQRDVQHVGRDERFKVISKNVTCKHTRELPSRRANEGFLIHRTSQDDDQIKVEKNNLDRSDSSCSSNTENSAYDSMPDSSNVNDLDSGDNKRSVNHHSSNINNTGDEPENAKSAAGSVEKVTKGNSKEDMIIHNFKVEKTECSERLAEMNAVVDNSENLLHHSKHINGDEDVLKAEFSRIAFEEKILRAGQNFSDIISQSDPPESRETSISGISASSSSPAEGKIKMPSTKPDLNSSENFVDHSLEDDKQAAPEETNYSKEWNSIENKKAGKKLPGHDISFSSAGVEINNSFGVEINNGFEDLTGSFNIDWNLSRNEEEAVSMDGETGTRDDKTEQPLLANQLSDQQLDQSSHEFCNLALQRTGNEEMEVTRRGPLSLDFPESASNQVHKFKNVGDTVGRNMSSEGDVIGSTTTCSEPLTIYTTSAESVSFNCTKGETVTVNTEHLQSSLTEAENEVPDAVIYRNNLTDKDPKEFSLKDSFKTMYHFVKVAYDSFL